MKGTNKKQKNKKENILELNKTREEIFTKAIEEAKKISKSKKGQDISYGKVVCYTNRKRK